MDAHEHRLPHVLFSTRSQDIDLYHKPMARNVQLWDGEYQAILDGPSATAEDIRRAAETVAAGGTFGYRFLFPAMNVGRHELYWHRPLVAYYDPRTKRPVLIDSAPTGYLTAYEEGGKSIADPVELWPRFLRRENHLENVALFQSLDETPPWKTLTNVFKMLDAYERNQAQPIAALLRPAAPHRAQDADARRLAARLAELAKKKHDRERAARLAKHLRSCLAPAHPEKSVARVRRPVPHLPAHRQSRLRGSVLEHHRFSVGRQVRQQEQCRLRARPPHAAVLKHLSRDLEGMGDHLLSYYDELIAARGMSDLVHIGELPFRWETQYPFTWMGGWLHNQEGRPTSATCSSSFPGAIAAGRW